MKWSREEESRVWEEERVESERESREVTAVREGRVEDWGTIGREVKGSDCQKRRKGRRAATYSVLVDNSFLPSPVVSRSRVSQYCEIERSEP